MKGIRWLLLFLLIPASLMGAEINGHFEAGYNTLDGSFKTDFKIGLAFVFLADHEIYGGQGVFVYLDGVEGEPFLDIYTFGYRMTIEPFYLKAEHVCKHPVVSSDYRYQLYHGSMADSTYISIGVEW